MLSVELLSLPVSLLLLPVGVGRRPLDILW
jgi:hypothetical protein